MKKPKLVTREWLREKLATAKSPSYVIERALIAIYERQTSEEQRSASTRVRNGVGFSGADAEIGTRCAKAAIAGKLAPWMIKIWSSVTRTGFPKICKYARQLNEVAREKADRATLHHLSQQATKRKAAGDYQDANARQADLPYEMYRELQLGTRKITTT